MLRLCKNLQLVSQVKQELCPNTLQTFWIKGVKTIVLLKRGTEAKARKPCFGGL